MDHKQMLEQAVALAIGRSIWGGDVEPRGGWLKAARAAIAAYEGFDRAVLGMSPHRANGLGGGTPPSLA